MTSLAAAALTCASACLAWFVTVRAARRRGIRLVWPPVFAPIAATAFAALLPPPDPAHAVLLGGIAVAAICDARTGRIFAPLTTLLAATTLAAAVLDGRAASAATGALAVGAALFALHALTAGRGIGLGDVRLGIGLGAGLGVAPGLVALACAFVFGGAVAAVLLATGRARRGGTLRFAPYLAAGTVAALVAGMPRP